MDKIQNTFLRIKEKELCWTAHKLTVVWRNCPDLHPTEHIFIPSRNKETLYQFCRYFLSTCVLTTEKNNKNKKQIKFLPIALSLMGWISEPWVEYHEQFPYLDPFTKIARFDSFENSRISMPARLCQVCWQLDLEPLFQASDFSLIWIKTYN